ncbi:MAG: hypothetical protein AAB305_05815 [Candidatus Zixiibacteriota bacterium]
MKANPVRNPDLAREVEELNEQVRLLAINLAAFLAREKDTKNRFATMEPDFHRLVSGLVSLVSDASRVIEASHHAPVASPQAGAEASRSMEQQLSALRTLCRDIQRRLDGGKSFPSQ